jgi:DNA mismatch repair protein MSH6
VGGTPAVGNDVSLGGQSAAASTMLLTGLNNGGKSTLLRSVGLAVILAHCGARVPASSALLSPADRVFTRVGASDSLAEGASTFLVEMAETQRILCAATPDSIVLADELGRGTATFDGFAIASAVLGELAASRVRCLFATHYHGLCSQFGTHPSVALRHMTCRLRAEDAGADDADDGAGLVFLYKLAEGPAPSSYGLQVARLAGVPASLVRAAVGRAKTLEARLAGVFDGAAAASDAGALGAAAAAALRAAFAAATPGADAATLRDACRQAQAALA